MAKKTVMKSKKFWFPVVAPDIFQNRELGEIAAFEGKDLIGRTIELAYSVVTNNPKDSMKKFIVAVSEIKGDKAYTIPKRIVYSDSYVQKIGKKYRERSLIVDTVNTKNNKAILKMFVLAVPKLTKSLRTEIQKVIKASWTEKLKKVDSAQLFDPVFFETLLKDLKKDVKHLFPIAQIRPWKVILE